MCVRVLTDVLYIQISKLLAVGSHLKYSPLRLKLGREGGGGGDGDKCTSSVILIQKQVHKSGGFYDSEHPSENNARAKSSRITGRLKLVATRIYILNLDS